MFCPDIKLLWAAIQLLEHMGNSSAEERDLLQKALAIKRNLHAFQAAVKKEMKTFRKRVKEAAPDREWPDRWIDNAFMRNVMYDIPAGISRSEAQTLFDKTQFLIGQWRNK